MIAGGRALNTITRPIEDPVLLDVAPARDTILGAQIIHIDTFGNATTNLGHETMRQAVSGGFRVRGQHVGELRRTYADVAPGTPVALIGSSGLLEIAVRDGSAAAQLGVRVGDVVSVE